MAPREERPWSVQAQRPKACGAKEGSLPTANIPPASTRVSATACGAFALLAPGAAPRHLVLKKVFYKKPVPLNSGTGSIFRTSFVGALWHVPFLALW